MEKITSKVTPYDVHVPPPKENNFLDKGVDIVHRIRFIIWTEMLLGINRLYLLKCHFLVSVIWQLYHFFVVGVTTYLMATGDTSEGIYMIYKQTNCIEYLILVFVTSLFQKRALEILFRDLAAFDDMINISKHVAKTIHLEKVVIWTLASLIYSVIECVIAYVCDIHMSNSDLMIYITVSAHDSETIFFVTLMQTILVRVRILKAHIAKTFNLEKSGNSKRSKVKDLANNAQLDTTALHRAYELLHKCAEQLNSVMSFPMIVMLFSSGLSSTMLLKKFFQVTQQSSSHDQTYKAIAIYTTVRCLKYTILVVIPCFYASITSNQVVQIRTIIHNAVNTFKLEKIERRKIKALFQLAKDNSFSYALWGVIRLSMSLPLNYASLCTTYLVITIQFSKFID